MTKFLTIHSMHHMTSTRQLVYQLSQLLFIIPWLPLGFLYIFCIIPHWIGFHLDFQAAFKCLCCSSSFYSTSSRFSCYIFYFLLSNVLRLGLFR